MSGVDFTVFTCPDSRSREMTCRGMLVGSRAFCDEPVVICVDRASEGLGRLTERLSTMPLDLRIAVRASLCVNGQFDCRLTLWAFNWDRWALH